MKKVSLWGVGALVALGFVAYLLASQVGAVDGTRKRIGFDPTNFGVPGDALSDMIADRPGHDRNQDRTPDNNPDEVSDGVSDCHGNFSGAGGDRRNACTTAGQSNIDSGDSVPENQFSDDGNGSTFADGTSVFDGVPDITRFTRVDRALDRGQDYTPDWINSDTYLARIGGTSSVGDADPDGGRVDGNGINNTDVRPHDNFTDFATSGPDGLNYASGPGDKQNDESPDAGGLATLLSGGSSSGCSLVAGTSAAPASSLAYLLVLLTPAALVVIRRKLRRK